MLPGIGPGRCWGSGAGVGFGPAISLGLSPRLQEVFAAETYAIRCGDLCYSRRAPMLFAAEYYVRCSLRLWRCGQRMRFRTKGAGARVLVTKIDLIFALHACMESFQVVEMEDILAFVNLHEENGGLPCSSKG